MYRIPGTTIAVGGAATLANTGFPTLLTGLVAVALLAGGLLLVRMAVVERG